MKQQIIQVAGFSNSGKTTLVEKLVLALKKENYRVGTIKHHGHGGELQALDVGKDSWKHRQAGSDVSAAVSKGELQLNVHKEVDWTAEELIELYRSFPIDLIVVEGFKSSPFPKLVIVRHLDDLKLLKKLENIFCVVSWFSLPEEVKKKSIKYFQIEDDTNYLDYTINKLRGQNNE